ncbi:MAG: polymer-forming cytoskeletal protein [Sediminibacterium sp.]|nr:polymer-forming cytoskeletal protein [Sediminibacterium sp.]
MNKFRDQLLNEPATNFGGMPATDEKKLFITRSTDISGILESDNDIVLDGNFNGVLYSKKTIHITQTGMVKGVIVCNEIKVEGEVEGSIYGLKVNLCKDSILKGTIHCTIINTEMNQFVEANIKLLCLEKSVYDSSSKELFGQLKDVFNKNNKENNYISIFQKKLDEIKPSTKFYYKQADATSDNTYLSGGSTGIDQDSLDEFRDDSGAPDA